jgi:translocation and assembly module TamB
MRKFIKFLLISIAGLILLLVCFAAFTQTRLFKDWLRDQIVQEAGKQLNGTLEIDRIDGNLISHFEISRLIVRDRQDTVLFLPRLEIQLLPGRLLDREIVLQVVALDSPRVTLRQKPDSLWNISTLVKETEPDKEDSEPFSWRVALENMSVTAAGIHILPLVKTPGLPHRMTGLSAKLSLSYRSDLLTLDQKNLHFNAKQPDFHLTGLAFSSTYRDSTFSVQNLNLRLHETRLDANCQLRLAAKPEYRFQFKANPLSLNEMRQIFPDLPLSGKPTVECEGIYRGDSLQFTINLNENGQALQVGGWVRDLHAIPEYSISGLLENIDFAAWFLDFDSTFAHRLNGTFVFEGRGISADSAATSLKIDLAGSRFQNQELQQFDLTGNFNAGKAQFALKSRGAFGRMALSGTVDNVVGKQQFDLSGRLENFDAGKLMFSDTQKTDLNLQISAQGRGLQPDSLLADVQINLSPSRMSDVEIDTVFCLVKIERGEFAVDTLQIESALGDFYLAGKISLASDNDLRFRGEIGDLHWVASKIEADTLRAKGRIAGHLQGKMDALSLIFDYDLKQLSYNTFSIASLRGNGSVNLISDSLSGKMASRIRQAAFSNVHVDSIFLRSTFTNNAADVELALARGTDFSGRSKLHFFADSTSRLDIPELNLRYKTQNWTSSSDNAHILISGDRLEIRDFRLASQNQRIWAEGALSLEGQQDFKFTLSNVNIAELVQVLDPSLSGIVGRLHVNSHLTGTFDTPNFAAQIQVLNGRLTNVEYDSLNIDLDYENALVSWLYELYRQEKRMLRGDGFLPIDLFAPDSVAMVDGNKPFRFQVATQGIDISFLQSFVKDVKNLQGLFVCDVSIENTLNDPEPVGHLSIFNGAFSFPQYGMKYKDIQARLNVDKKSIRVTEFDVGTEVKVVKGFRRKKKTGQQIREEMRGRLWIVPGSYIDFDTTGFLSGVDSMNLTVKANEFLLANSRDYQAQISGEVKIFGDVRAPRFDGKMRILRSSLYLPALEETGLYDEERVKSLLAGVQDTAKIETAYGDSESSEYFNNLRGSLKIEIPKNTWVRSPEMNIELSGNLEIVKDGAEFEQPFGTIQVVRGTYDLFGSYKFDIDDGTLFFAGGQDFNPGLDIKARHTLRNRDRSISELVLHVTNRMFSPDLKFFLDDQEIETRFALQILLAGGVGKGDQQSAGLFATNGGRDATGLLTGLLTSQLSRFLLNNQILDVVEIKGDLAGDQASILLGKYITNKLFLSLEKAINLGKGDNEGISDEVTIEYALSRYLILQAIAGDQKTTGFDVFWKFSK